MEIWVTFRRNFGQYLPKVSPQLDLMRLFATKKTKLFCKGIVYVILKLKQIQILVGCGMYFLKCFCKFILRGKCVKAGRWFPLGKIKLRINLNSLEAISVSNGY